MININDLTGIPRYRRAKIIQCLDDLMYGINTKAELKPPVITGYNLYDLLSISDRVVTFSHMHRTRDYRQDMLSDLEKMGYRKRDVVRGIRDKLACYLWEIDFEISPGIRIRDADSGEYLDTKKYAPRLDCHPQFKEKQHRLIGEGREWELGIPFGSRDEMLRLIGLFLRKSSKYLYDNDWNRIKETPNQKRIRKPWRGAWVTPILLLGPKALMYRGDLPQFTPVVKFILVENQNEISFVINNNLPLLRGMDYYKMLLDFGFKEEDCLANDLFVKKYIDVKRV